ncbi:MAG: YchE family NAAT transporter [Proteobacteria bacterium]|nr:YchE family NAAT transporter [Pseudomonadota bacterium]MBU1737845.1 YchE family NAAT transporter [Pseudomonadota bacterium]
MVVENWAEYFKFFAAMMAIVNPLGAVPVFINLTSNQNTDARSRTSVVSALSTTIILLIVLITGELILQFFGISIASFRVGGGILILLMAISMLHAKMSHVKQTEEEALDSEDREAVAVVPLATPLLAGPGAISTVILYAQRQSSLTHYLVLAGGIVLLGLITWLVFRLAPFLSNLLGRTGINVVTRLMGLIMAAVGVEFIANGLRQLFPVLAG